MRAAIRSGIGDEGDGSHRERGIGAVDRDGRGGLGRAGSGFWSRFAGGAELLPGLIRSAVDRTDADRHSLQRDLWALRQGVEARVAREAPVADATEKNAEAR